MHFSQKPQKTPLASQSRNEDTRSIIHDHHTHPDSGGAARRMAPTPKIKLLRVLSVLQCWVALWILVLGIVEHVRGSWIHTGLGIAIWTSVWVSI